MLENLVLLTGTVAHVSIKPKSTWVQGSFKLDCGDFQTWIEIKGLNPADRAIQMLEGLKDQQIILRGRFTSYVMKANPPEYPNETKRYQISVSKGAIDLVDGEVGVNYCMFSGVVHEARETGAGVLFAEVGITYHNPSNDTYGTYITRIQCPTGTVLEPKEKIVVIGTIAEGDAKGMLVHASQILKTQKPPVPSSVAADVSSSQET